MKTHWFQIELKTCPLDFESFAEKAYEAGCDDGTVSQCDGVLEIAFARDADSLDDAVASAIRQLESIGCTIARIVFDDSMAAENVA